MNIQVLELKDSKEIIGEMQKLGVDPAGVRIMAPKFQAYALKIGPLSACAANILKQEALARGGEAALPWAALKQKTRTAEVLLFGNKQQLYSLSRKLKAQPFQLVQVSEALEKLLQKLEKPVTRLKIGPKTFDLNKKTLLLGVLNITPDSFSDGGRYLAPQKALAQARQLLKAGADIIDIGAESSRPGATQISAKAELARLLPVLKELRRMPGALISLDTTKSVVARECLKLGIHLLNDISGLNADPKLAELAAHYKVPLILMHRSAPSRTMQNRTKYTDLIQEILNYLQGSVARALAAGVARDKIIIDPGIGFGKTTEQNLEIFKRLPEFKSLGLPIMIGASRKSLIGNVLNAPVADRLEGTLALSAWAIAGGASLLRVHDVKENLRVVKLCDAIRRTTRT